MLTHTEMERLKQNTGFISPGRNYLCCESNNVTCTNIALNDNLLSNPVTITTAWALLLLCILNCVRILTANFKVT